MVFVSTKYDYLHIYQKKYDYLHDTGTRNNFYLFFYFCFGRGLH